MTEDKYPPNPQLVHDFLIANRMEHLRLKDKAQDAVRQMGVLNDIHEHVATWKDRQCTREGCKLHAQFSVMQCCGAPFIGGCGAC